VWKPKYRKKQLYGGVAKYLGNIFHQLARERESRILEGHLCVDHVHMLIEIPPKYSVAQVVGYIKGKSAIAIARRFVGKQRNFTGQSFWARGYYVTTVGRDETVIRKYIQAQEEEDKRLEQLELFKDN
jgi:putative transposase